MVTLQGTALCVNICIVSPQVSIRHSYRKLEKRDQQHTGNKREQNASVQEITITLLWLIFVGANVGNFKVNHVI